MHRKLGAYLKVIFHENKCFFYSFWVAMDLIRCPGALGKIFGPLRVHRGCTGGAQGGRIGCWIWGLRESKFQLWINFQNLLILPNLALFCPKLTQFGPFDCCINELSVALSRQNLKLGADFTLKNGYVSINITGWSACALHMHGTKNPVCTWHGSIDLSIASLAWNCLEIRRAIFSHF